jgi:glycoside/pentoside/hexuronide:cation symporter, GPH family
MTDSAPGDIRSAQKLNFFTKLAYGAGDMSGGITANLQAWSLLIFLTNVAGLNPALAGQVLLIGKVWDAVNDPAVGVLSDRTHSPRWGRRHPWMLYGAIPLGLSFCLMWIVPDFNITLKFWYYVLVGILFNAAYTVVNVPYSALTAELTQDYDERTSLNSFRLAFSLGGAVLALILGFVMQQIFRDAPEQQYWVTGVVCAILSVVTLYWCIWGTIGRTRQNMQQASLQPENDTESMPILEQFKVALSNRPFLYVIGIYLFSWLALQFTAAIIPYFVVSWMGLDSYFLVAALVQGTAILMLFVCNAISKRVGKRSLYFMGMGLWIIVQAGLFFLQPDQVWLMYLLCFAASFGVATAYLVPWAMLPDVIELDELKTGQRREGVFYAFMTLLQKIGLAVGLALVGIALEQAGFVEKTATDPFPVQPESALLAIRIAIGPLPTVSLILGVILAYFYPITREKHAEILLKLHQRKQARQLETAEAASHEFSQSPSANDEPTEDETSL